MDLHLWIAGNCSRLFCVSEPGSSGTQALRKTGISFPFFFSNSQDTQSNQGVLLNAASLKNRAATVKPSWLFSQPSLGSREIREEIRTLNWMSPVVKGSVNSLTLQVVMSSSVITWVKARQLLLEIICFPSHKSVYSFPKNVLISSPNVNKLFNLLISFLILFFITN